MMAHAVQTVPFWLTWPVSPLPGPLHLKPELHGKVRQKAGILVTILEEKYGFDRFNDWFFAGGARKFGSGLWRYGDVTVIDGLMVNGSARLIGWFAGVVRLIQSGFIYHYAFFMIIGFGYCSRTSSFSEGLSLPKNAPALSLAQPRHMGPDRRRAHRPRRRRQEPARSAGDRAPRRGRGLSGDGSARHRFPDGHERHAVRRAGAVDFRVST